MAHFAKLDQNNKVIEVIVVSNQDILDEKKNESEQIGIEFCKMLHGKDTRWVQTSYNHKFRGRYAGVGMYYDEILDEFVNSAGDE